jgi:hypothetical protein
MIHNPPDCPPAGAGVHSWILAAANWCRLGGMSSSEAGAYIAQRITRPPNPASEIVVAVAKAYSTSATTFRSTYRGTHNTAPVPISEIQFDETKLRTIASRISPPANWRHWLWERSPKRPTTMNAWSYLAHLYRPGETVLVFDKFDSKSPMSELTIGAPTDCRVPKSISTGGRHGFGVWYLCNPVDGRWYPNPRQGNKLSCRSEESITSFRYAVLESDQALANEWLAFIFQLPIRVAALYTSGARSIHCLVLIDARSKDEWDATIAPLKRPLKVLGADPACLSAVRLTRLPQCSRPEKGGFQKLLYLCPNPPLAPLVDLPVLFPRAEMLTRWRCDYPRWNPDMEANL